MFTRSSARADRANGASSRPTDGARPIKTTLDKVDIAGLFRLSEDGEIRIDGEVEGNIRCQALTVGESGSMRGDLRAESVVLAGRFRGRIDAGSLVIAATANVVTEDAHVRDSVIIEKGASFEGAIRRPAGKGPRGEAEAAQEEPRKASASRPRTVAEPPKAAAAPQAASG